MFSSNSISNLLGISDRNLKFTGEIFEKYLKGIKYQDMSAYITYKPKACPHCNSANENYSIVKNGSQNVKVLINRINNNPTLINVKKQRFYCKHCKKTFIAKTSLTEKGCFIGNAVKQSIIDNLSEIMPMNVIAKNHYVSNSTIARTLRSTEKQKCIKWLPEVLGIDEFKSTKNVDGSMSVNLVDIETGKIIDIVSDRRKRYLREYFLCYPKRIRKKVKYITTDMYPTYIDLAKELFPNAKIVLDKFHIVQLFTRNMNKLRINEMKKFKTYTHEYKVLKRYWKIVLAKDWKLERLNFYRYFCYKKLTNSRGIKDDILSFSKTLKHADTFYQKLLMAIEYKDIESFENLLNKNIDDIPECFRTSVTSLNKYKDFAINSLKTNYTNASVEGNNNLIKSFKRVSYGFRSFRNMRCRILLRNKYKTIKNSRFKPHNREFESAA